MPPGTTEPEAAAMKHTLFPLALFLALLLAAPLAWAGQRQALVIGNAAYTEAPLRNPANDARDVAAKLRQLGFAVTELIDADQRKMETAVRDFTRALGKDGVGLFYYAGHGLQVEGENYLVPLGADIQVEEDVSYKAVPAGRVLAGMRAAGNPMNLVILDACRNNPYRSFRGETRGLARMNAAKGSLVLYATQPGEVAADGQGRNGLFTEKLLAALDQPGLKAEEVFKRTAQAVDETSGHKQTPWQEGVILGDFYFREPAGSPPDPGAEAAALERQRRENEEQKLALIRERERIDAERQRLASEAAAQAKPPAARPEPPPPPPAEGKGYREPLTGMEFVKIDGGSFLMGSPAGEKGRYADEKQHRVSVGGFYLGKTEVTNAQYRKYKPGHDSGSGLNGDDQPVVGVDWNDATAYADWLSQQTGKKYRLPTEAEWEYAARAGTTTAYYWGHQASHDKANYGKDECCEGLAQGKDRWVVTAPVGRFDPNPWGLYDMHGNVWEWTCSAYVSDYDGSEKQCASKNDASGFRALRGGSWYNTPRYVRSAHRLNNSPGTRTNDLGFRLLQD